MVSDCLLLLLTSFKDDSLPLITRTPTEPFGLVLSFGAWLLVSKVHVTAEMQSLDVMRRGYFAIAIALSRSIRVIGFLRFSTGHVLHLFPRYFSSLNKDESVETLLEQATSTYYTLLSTTNGPYLGFSGSATLPKSRSFDNTIPKMSPDFPSICFELIRTSLLVANPHKFLDEQAAVHYLSNVWTEYCSDGKVEPATPTAPSSPPRRHGVCVVHCLELRTNKIQAQVAQQWLRFNGPWDIKRYQEVTALLSSIRVPSPLQIYNIKQSFVDTSAQLLQFDHNVSRLKTYSQEIRPQINLKS